MEDAEQSVRPEDSVGDDVTDVSDIANIENLRSVNGIPYIIANKIPGGDSVAGMTIRQTTVDAASGRLLSAKIDIMDMVFIVNSLSIYIKGDIDIVSNFKSFSYLMTQKSYDAMLDRLNSASQNLASAAENFRKLSWHDLEEVGHDSESGFSDQSHSVSEETVAEKDFNSKEEN